MLSEAEKDVLEHTVHEAYMEIFPTPTIESKLDVLEPGSYIAVTCSPSRPLPRVTARVNTPCS